jgi:hypothetical protein
MPAKFFLVFSELIQAHLPGRWPGEEVSFDVRVYVGRHGMKDTRIEPLGEQRN